MKEKSKKSGGDAENIMNDLEQAKKLLNTGEYSCVLYRAGTVYTSTKRGVAPLLEWRAAGTMLKDFSAADKIIGKAAAMLLVLAGVKEVFAPVISKPALQVLSSYGIHAEYETLTEMIINRSGTGPCPMEQAVADIDDPAQALIAIQNKLKLLQSGEKENK